MSAKPRLATVWLGGCSGCHMSLLDMDERLSSIAGRSIWSTRRSPT
jgi:NAD-reducing hydrogenase small subunit